MRKMIRAWCVVNVGSGYIHESSVSGFNVASRALAIFPSFTAAENWRRHWLNKSDMEVVDCKIHVGGYRGKRYRTSGGQR